MGNSPHCSFLIAVTPMNQFTIHHPQVQFQPRAPEFAAATAVVWTASELGS